MYDSRPKEREGETIEEVLPAAIHTTSTTTRPPAPRKRTVGTGGVRLVVGQGLLVVGLAALCVVLTALLLISLVL